MIKELPILKYIFIASFIICVSCQDSKETQTELNNLNLDSLRNVASTLFWDGKLDSSLMIYNEIIHRDSLNSNYVFSRGAVKYGKKDFNGALSDLNKSLNLNPNNTQAVYYKAMIYEQMAIIDSSNYLFNYLISLKPDSLFYLTERAKYYERHNDFEMALIDWNNIISLIPNNSELYNNRGVVFVNLKKYDNAINDFNRSIDLKPSFINLINRSQAYYYTAKYKLSLIDVEVAIKIDSSKSDVFLQRAGIKFHLKDEFGACQDFKKAAEMGNSEAQGYYKECIEKGILKIKE